MRYLQLTCLCLIAIWTCPFSSKAASSVEHFKIDAAEKKKIETLFSGSKVQIHDDEAYRLLFLSPKNISTFVAEPTGEVSQLILWKDDQALQQIRFSDATRVSSLKKIEAFSFKDVNSDGLLDILIIARFKSETDAAKDAPDFFVGQSFVQEKDGRFHLDEEQTQIGTATVRNYLKKIQKPSSSSLKSTTQTTKAPKILSDLDLNAGMDYPKAKKLLLKAGWKTEISTEDKLNRKNLFPEISCGSGSMPVCSVSFSKKEYGFCLGISSSANCKSGYCILEIGEGGCG